MLIFIKTGKPDKGCPLMRRYRILYLTLVITGSFQKGQSKTQGSKELRLTCLCFTVSCKLSQVILCCKDQVSAGDLRCPFWAALAVIQPLRGFPLLGEMLCPCSAFPAKGSFSPQQGGLQSCTGLEFSECCGAGWLSWTTSVNSWHLNPAHLASGVRLSLPQETHFLLHVLFKGIEHRWQTQGPQAESGPPPCFIRPGTLFLPGSGTALLSPN